MARDDGKAVNNLEKKRSSLEVLQVLSKEYPAGADLHVAAGKLSASVSDDKPKIKVSYFVGGKEFSLSINLKEVPVNGAEICIEVDSNGISSASIKENKADKSLVSLGSKEKTDNSDDEAQVSRSEMDKLLSTMKSALKDHKIASIIDQDYRPVIEGAIEDANQFLKLNPDAKKAEIEDKIEMLKSICQSLISAMKNNGVSAAPKGVKTHFSHKNPEHEFKFVEGSSKSFHCEGCKKSGWGKRYECSSCPDSFFHEECMEAKPTAFNNFTGTTFELLPEPKGKCFKSCPCDSCRRKCNGCGKIIEGMVYYCEEQDMALHPLCFKLEREVSANGISFYLRDNMAKKACACCGKKKVGSSSSSIHGWSYVSKDEEHHIHVSCAMELFSKCKSRRLSADNSNNEIVLKEKELSLEKKKHKKGEKFLKIMYSVLRAIVGILFGDPVTPLLIFVAEQVFNL